MQRVTIKTPHEVEKMRVAGHIVRDTLELVERSAKAGMTTLELDALAEDFIRSRGAIPSFLNYEGYPRSICASVNSEVVHGIPGKKKLNEGDLVSIDIGAVINGFQGDAARTFFVGEAPSEEAAELVRVTRECFFKGIEHAKAGNHISDIGAAVQSHAEAHGYGVVRELVGHGIGREMHEPPEVPNFTDPRMGRGIRLIKGMAIAVEPMINMGGADVYVEKNGWTVVTADGSLSAHYENTIAITDGEPDILTL